MAYDNPVGEARPLWRDYSRYQLMVDFDVARMNGVLGMAARSTISYAYVDPYFETNWNGAGKAGMYRTSYHVIYPNELALKQADNWYRVHPRLDTIPRVIDLELENSMTPQKIADTTWQLSEIVLQRDGVRPIIYSRYPLIESWLKYWTKAQLDAHYWWLAQYRLLRYLEHAGPPQLPVWSDGTPMISRDMVVMHQTADKKAGFQFEQTGSASVDWDRWEIGNETQMHEWIKTTWGGDYVPPIPPADVQKIVRVTATALNVREQSNGSARDIGTLVGGSEVPVYETDGLWYRIGGWIHRDYTTNV